MLRERKSQVSDLTFSLYWREWVWKREMATHRKRQAPSRGTCILDRPLFKSISSIPEVSSVDRDGLPVFGVALIWSFFFFFFFFFALFFSQKMPCPSLVWSGFGEICVELVALPHSNGLSLYLPVGWAPSSVASDPSSISLVPVALVCGSGLANGVVTGKGMALSPRFLSWLAGAEGASWAAAAIARRRVDAQGPVDGFLANFDLARVPVGEVVPGRLFISGSEPAESACLPSHITHVLCVNNVVRPAFPERVHYLVMDVVDAEEASFDLDSAELFIRSALAAPGNAVLVHCTYGISRSATAVCAFLVKRDAVGAGAALSRLREAHPQAHPNLGFLSQLERWSGEGGEGGGGDGAAVSTGGRWRCRGCRMALVASVQGPRAQGGVVAVGGLPHWAAGVDDGALCCPRCKAKIGKVVKGSAHLTVSKVDWESGV